MYGEYLKVLAYWGSGEDGRIFLEDRARERKLWARGGKREPGAGIIRGGGRKGLRMEL